MKLAKGRKTYLHLKRKNGLTFKNTKFFFSKIHVLENKISQDMYVLGKIVNCFLYQLFEVIPNAKIYYIHWMHIKFLKKKHVVLSRRWNISFRNIVLEIFRIFPPSITKLRKTKEVKNFQICNFFFLSAQYVLLTKAE